MSTFQPSSDGEIRVRRSAGSVFWKKEKEKVLRRFSGHVWNPDNWPIITRRNDSNYLVSSIQLPDERLFQVELDHVVTIKTFSCCC